MTPPTNRPKKPQNLPLNPPRTLRALSHTSPPPPSPPPALPPYPPTVPIDFTELGLTAFASVAGGAFGVSGGEGAGFGEAIDLSPSLELLAVGAPCANVFGTSRQYPSGTASSIPCAGAVHLFEPNGASGWKHVSVLSAVDAAVTDGAAGPLQYLRFGSALAFARPSSSNNPFPPAAPPPQTGLSVPPPPTPSPPPPLPPGEPPPMAPPWAARSSTELVVGASGDSTSYSSSRVRHGAAYVFRGVGGRPPWTMTQRLMSSSCCEQPEAFGAALTLSGAVLVVGAPQHHAASAGATGTRAGAAYVFELAGSGAWVRRARCPAADAARPAPPRDLLPPTHLAWRPHLIHLPWGAHPIHLPW